APARLERPATVLSDEELARILESESREDDFCCEEDDLIDSGTFVPLPGSGSQSGPSPLLVAALAIPGVVALAGLVITFLWFYGIGRLPAFARPYAQIVRLTSWSGAGPGRSQTP